ncbi:MAG: hypothetical protein WC455_24770 [Dehalococcoidia bacterium]|jgi:hypothetical protein
MTRAYIGEFEHYSRLTKLKTIAVTVPVYTIIRMYAEAHSISIREAVGTLVGVAICKLEELPKKKDKDAGLH